MTAPFDYASFAAGLVTEAPVDPRLSAALQGKLCLCAFWMEAMLAVRMVSGMSLKMDLLPQGRDGFLLEQSRDRWVSVELLHNSNILKIQCVGCQPGFGHEVTSPTEPDAMRALAQQELKAILAVILRR